MRTEQRSPARSWGACHGPALRAAPGGTGHHHGPAGRAVQPRALSRELGCRWCGRGGAGRGRFESRRARGRARHGTRAARGGAGRCCRPQRRHSCRPHAGRGPPAPFHRGVHHREAHQPRRLREGVPGPQGGPALCREGEAPEGTGRRGPGVSPRPSGSGPAPHTRCPGTRSRLSQVPVGLVRGPPITTAAFISALNKGNNDKNLAKRQRAVGLSHVNSCWN